MAAPSEASRHTRRYASGATASRNRESYRGTTACRYPTGGKAAAEADGNAADKSVHGPPSIDGTGWIRSAGQCARLHVGGRRAPGRRGPLLAAQQLAEHADLGDPACVVDLGDLPDGRAVPT